MEDSKGKGWFGWLGRQFGYVAKAVKTDVKSAKIVYRDGRVEEVPHPTEPNLTLRRTVIDEVIEKKPVEQNPAIEEKKEPSP